MGSSLFITTEEERIEIAQKLIPTASYSATRGMRGIIKDSKKLRSERQDITYNPKTDEFSILGTNTRGDLLNIFSMVNNVELNNVGEEFCRIYDLDYEIYNEKKELFNFVNYVPTSLNMSMRIFFMNLSHITNELADECSIEYGWSLSTLNKFKITIFNDEGNDRIAFPVYDRHGRLTAFNAVNHSLTPQTKNLGNNIPLHLFPEISELDQENPILITQGYISTFCALSQGIDATQLVGWRGEDISQDFLTKFAKREVVLAFPGSQTHRTNALKLADLLHPIAQEISIVEWPEINGSSGTKIGNLTSYFVKHGGTIESLNELQIRFNSGEPLPLMRELSQSVEYPVDALAPVIRDAVIDVSNAMQCSPVLAAQGFMAVAAFASQAHVDVEIDARKSPTSCFFVTIAESGERKSSVDKLAMAPVNEKEKELRIKNKQEMIEYNIKVAVRKKQEIEALKSSDPVKAMQDLGAPPERPLDASLSTEEPTYEGLVVKLIDGQPSMALASDEGARLFGSNTMNRDNLQKTAAGLSTIWDGRPITRTRVKDGSLTLDGRRLTIHLMMQPNIASQLVNSELLIGQGLASRILLASPPSNIGNRPYSGVNLDESQAYQHYKSVISDILSRELPIRPGTTNELVPRALGLGDDAKECWVAFHDQVEADMRDGQQYCNIRGFAAKAAEHVARVACVMTYITDSEATEIPIEWVESAIRIVNYHLNEAKRLFNASSDSPDLVLAQQSLEWLRLNYPIFSLTELYQNGPMQVRSKAKSERIVKILVEHGWVERIEGGAIIKFNKRRTAWKIAE